MQIFNQNIAHRELIDLGGIELTGFAVGLDKGNHSALPRQATNALLAGGQQSHSLQPDMKLQMAGLEYSPDLYSEVLAALVALVAANAGAFALHLANAIKATAMRASWAMRPNPRLKIFVGCFFIVKAWGG